MAAAFAMGFVGVSSVMEDAPQGPAVTLKLDWNAAIAFSSHIKSPRRVEPPIQQAALPGIPNEFFNPVPAPMPRSLPLARSLTKLVSFHSSPFPYDGDVPRSHTRFLNYEQDGRMGRKTSSGRVYWADETYSDSRVLLHIPKGFDIEKPSVMVVFFHGHGATLERDVAARQQVPQQITRSQMNAVLVAPQFAVDARDSSAGNLWRPDGMRKFLDEVTQKLTDIQGSALARKKFANMPVVLVGYSGGYLPTASALARGGVEKRIKGVVLLDGLYGNIENFADWISRDNGGFFVSSYTGSTRRGNERLKEILTGRDIAYNTGMPRRLLPGSVTFISADERHRDYVTRAWTDDPISDVVGRLEGVAPRTPMAVSASLAPGLTN